MRRSVMRRSVMRRSVMRRVAIAVGIAVGVVALTLAIGIGSAFADAPHFIFANVTNVTSNTITVQFKEAGLGDSLDSVKITLTGTAECINLGSNHPKASNKESFSASDTFNISNGQASGSLTDSAAGIDPPCSPPMTICWTGLMVTDPTFHDSINIPGTFCAP